MFHCIGLPKHTIIFGVVKTFFENSFFTMGSCSGKPLHHDAVETSSPNKTSNVHHTTAGHERPSDTETVPTPHTPIAKIGSLEVSDSEEFESAGSPEEDRHGPPSTTGTYEEVTKLKGGDDDVNANLPKPKLRVGYSSGGSSSTLEGDEIRHGSSRSHLLELKHSLSAGGDLCKGVVRIEVSHTVPWMWRRVILNNNPTICISRVIIVVCRRISVGR